MPDSLKVRNYKCFGDHAEGSELIKPDKYHCKPQQQRQVRIVPDAVQQACKDAPIALLTI
jgi:hypothetical protein